MAHNIETINQCGGCLTGSARAHIRPCPVQTSPQDAPSSSECTICQEPYDERNHVAAKITDVPTCAGHVFGLGCIVKWISSCHPNALNCPVCRGVLLRVRHYHGGQDRQDEHENDDDNQDEEANTTVSANQEGPENSSESGTSNAWEDISDSNDDCSEYDESESEDSEGYDSDNSESEFDSASRNNAFEAIMARAEAVLNGYEEEDSDSETGSDSDSDSDRDGHAAGCAAYHEALAQEIVSSILEEHEGSG